MNKDLELKKKIYNERIKDYIQTLINNDIEYEYIGKDRDGLYLYDSVPEYVEKDNMFSMRTLKYLSYIISATTNDEIEQDILNLFEYGEVILIEEGVKRIEGLIYSPVTKLFKLLSEVQGIEINPYDEFDIKDNGRLLNDGPYYFDKNFKRYNYNNSEQYAEEILRGILTGTMKILKCKKAIILTEDDIICLKYYLKNGYKYIANEITTNREIDRRLKLFKNKGICFKRSENGDKWEHYSKQDIGDEYGNIVADELSFEHYDYPEIWDIEELLEQERVSND